MAAALSQSARNGRAMDSLAADVQYIRGRIDALTEMYGEAMATQAAAMAKLESLAGNGQPGRVGVLERSRTELEVKVNSVADRLSAIEGKLWWVIGGGAAAAVGLLELILRLKAFLP
jgi:hypothetical protein